jgi:hypothetical protein
MTDLSRFHQHAVELLRHIGFTAERPPADQDVFSLSVDDAYALHLGILNEHSWFILVELPDPIGAAAPLAAWLRDNHLNDGVLQPVFSLDEQDRPCCYLRLPLEGHSLPDVLQAFDTMLDRADQLTGKNG